MYDSCNIILGSRSRMGFHEWLRMVSSYMWCFSVLLGIYSNLSPLFRRIGQCDDALSEFCLLKQSHTVVVCWRIPLQVSSSCSSRSLWSTITIELVLPEGILSQEAFAKVYSILGKRVVWPFSNTLPTIQCVKCKQKYWCRQYWEATI